MSSCDIENERQVDYLSLFKNSNELYKLITEYLKLKSEYDEPLDAKKMRTKAEEFLRKKDCDYQKVLRLMKTALKIMKSCNGIT